MTEKSSYSSSSSSTTKDPRFLLPPFVQNLSILQDRNGQGDYFKFLDCTDEEVHWEKGKALEENNNKNGKRICSKETSTDKDPQELTSNSDAFVHLIKGNIGTGILAMPQSFKNAGLLTATFGTMILGVFCVYTMHLLLRVANELGHRNKVKPLTFGDVAAASFQSGPPFLQKYSVCAKIVTNTFLYLTQIGICCVYLVFVADNLQEVLKSVYGVNMSPKACMTFLLIPFLALSWVRDLKSLAPLMMLADVITALGLAIIMCSLLQNLPSVAERQIFFTSWHQITLFFSTTIFAFEGIAVVLPLQNSMKNPGDFGGWNGILNKGMSVVLVAYITIGFFGYLKYGDNVKGSITLNLEANMWAEAVRMMMALAIYLSYALQYYVPIELTRTLLKQHLTNRRAVMVTEFSYRTLLVLAIFLLAETVPDLGLFISLIGALTSTTLSFVFPPIFSVMVNWSLGYGRYRWLLWKDLLIVVFGVTTCLTGTYISSQAINRA